MAAAIKLQQSLFVGGGDFVGQLHKKAPDKRVYMAQNRQNCETDDKAWQQKGYPLQDAIRQAQAWETIEAADCYATVNGFGWQKGSGRTLSAAEAVNGFYVDFDRYNKPELRDLSAGDFLDKVLADNPWLPIPTLFEDSGNGCWMYWLFDRPLLVNNQRTQQYDFLSQWQTCQQFLINKLLPYGADPKCADAARVVRISGTVNTKTNRAAQAWTTAERYTFAELKAAFNLEFRRDNPRKQCVPTDLKASQRQRQRQPAADRQVNRVQVSNLFNLYSLAHARMQDLRKLAQVRGGRLTEHRRMAVWIYAVSAAQFCKFEDTLRAEVESFILDCVGQPEKYLKSVNYESTVDRFRNEALLIASGVPRQKVRQQLGRDKSRYTLSNRYIISQLEVDGTEQRHLKTIIDKDEHRRRNTISKRQKRRAAGAEERAAYIARSEQRQQQAVQLRHEGLSVRAIADQMGLSVGAVHRYLVTK
jgi:hypothetical protein